jgi:hypothetical protein
MYYVKYKMPIFMDSILLDLGAGAGICPIPYIFEKNENIRKKTIYQILRPNIKGIKKYILLS